MNGQPNQCRVLGVNVSGLTVPELHNRIASLIEDEQKALVLNVNVHALNLAYKRPWLREYLDRAHLVFCDGAGVVLGARILGCSLGRRITYADWMWKLAAFCEKHGYALYFLGARPGVAERAAASLKARHPGLRIAGTQHGYFGRSPGSPENEAVLRQINAVQPDILVVGLGMPAQERWLMENWERVQAHVALTGGAVFDYLSGDLRRAPRWMTDHGLEWLGRLLIEPRRLWRRYVVGNPLFLWRVLGQRLGLLEIE